MCVDGQLAEEGQAARCHCLTDMQAQHLPCPGSTCEGVEWLMCRRIDWVSSHTAHGAGPGGGCLARAALESFPQRVSTDAELTLCWIL